MDQSISKKQKNEHFPTIIDVANYFLHIYKNNSKKMDVLIIQKLCYWTQCHYLAQYHKPLFHEDFKHYELGPCEESLINYSNSFRPVNWIQMKNEGKNVIASEIILDKFEYRNPIFEKEQILIMDFVYETTKDLGTFQMVNKTHD